MNGWRNWLISEAVCELPEIPSSYLNSPGKNWNKGGKKNKSNFTLHARDKFPQAPMNYTTAHSQEKKLIHSAQSGGVDADADELFKVSAKGDQKHTQTCLQLWLVPLPICISAWSMKQKRQVKGVDVLTETQRSNTFTEQLLITPLTASENTWHRL